MSGYFYNSKVLIKIKLLKIKSARLLLFPLRGIEKIGFYF